MLVFVPGLCSVCAFVLGYISKDMALRYHATASRHWLSIGGTGLLFSISGLITLEWGGNWTEFIFFSCLPLILFGLGWGLRYTRYPNKKDLRRLAVEISDQVLISRGHSIAGIDTRGMFEDFLEERVANWDLVLQFLVQELHIEPDKALFMMEFTLFHQKNISVSEVPKGRKKSQFLKV